MPATGSHLFGRDEELQALDAAWEDPNLNILTLVAWGGVGKSTLINHWLATRGHEGADQVIAWSFYTQGTTQRVVSADLFIEAALRILGDPDPSFGSHWDRAERLAKLIRSSRTLLVLDGLEPLQFPPGADEGRLRDNTLSILLGELASQINGLCLISSRLGIANLERFEGTTAVRLDLDELSPQAGAELLRANGAKGSARELEQAAIDFGCHALALTLLGSFLDEAYGGDIRKRQEVKPLESDTRHGGHALRVLDSYESWFGPCPELELLYVLGLFDRPAAQLSIDAIRRGDPLVGYTTELRNLNRREWNQLVGRMRRSRLLAPGVGSEALDAHPLVRDHFGSAGKKRFTESWQKANERLFEHYRSSAVQQPETLEEMEPLFLAVISGCRAGFHMEALESVYRPRIMRGEQHYASTVLSAHSALLFVLSHFFEGGDWRRPHSTLDTRTQLSLLMDAGHHLTAIRGYAAAEVLDCYETARALAEGIDDPGKSLVVELALIRLLRMRGALSESIERARALEKTIESNGQERAKPFVDRALGSAYFYVARFEESFQRVQAGDVDYGYEVALRNSQIDLNDPAISCAGYAALVQCIRGDIEIGLDGVREALSRALDLEHSHTLAVTLLISSMVHQIKDQPHLTARYAKQLAVLCAGEGFSLWRLAGDILELWGSALMGEGTSSADLMGERITQWRQSGAALFLPYWHGLLADSLMRRRDLPLTPAEATQAQASLETGIRVAKTTGEEWWTPELMRLQGILQGRDDPAAATETFLRARMVAESQGGRLADGRIEASMARLSEQSDSRR